MMISRVRELAEDVLWWALAVICMLLALLLIKAVVNIELRPTHQNHLGKTVVIQNDTLKIINYSHGVYGLNNGLAIDSSLVKDVLIK